MKDLMSLYGKKGNPCFSVNHGIIVRLSEMSEAYGIKITVDSRGYGVIEFL